VKALGRVVTLFSRPESVLGLINRNSQRGPANDLPHVNVQNTAISVIYLEKHLQFRFVIFTIHAFVFCITHD